MAKGGNKKKGGKPQEVDKRRPKHSNDANRANKTVGFKRDAATVKRLKMYNTKAVRDKKGRVIHEELQSKEAPNTRIQPDRRWFGNTRVIGQKQLENFRQEMSTKVNDAYTVLLREKKLPLQLLEDPEKKLAGKQLRSNLLTTQPFSDTFGPNKKRKRPNLSFENYTDLVQSAETNEEQFGVKAEELSKADVAFKDSVREMVFEKGQSRRIWGELYKVLDSSDVIIQVLDARDPMGTRCKFLENHIRKHLRHKHVILLLNKCDLVPAWVTKRWLHYLSREFPTLAFHASITNPFGKGSLLSLLRQLARLRSDKQAISVGFVGYPNVGKSSVINTLKAKKVCKAAPVPGETKVWQYITLMRRVFLIDCPGVVYNRTADTETDIVLKGVVRVEKMEDATAHVPMVLQRVKPEYLKRAYKIKEWTDAEDFLTQLSKMSGRLLKGGDSDLNTAARMVLYDWQRGKIPFFTLPPDHTDEVPVVEGAAEKGAEDLGGVVLAEAVTEEDALQEAGAAPDNARAAARAMREGATDILVKQTRGAIPVQQEYYLPDDERKEGRGNDDVVYDNDVISDVDDGEDEGDEDVEEDSEQEDDGEEGEDEEGPAKKRVKRDAKEGGKKGGKKAAAKEVGDEGDDSDGLDDEELSWEAVMKAVQGGEAEGDGSDDEDEEKQQQAPQPQVVKRTRGGKGRKSEQGGKKAGKKGKGKAKRDMKTLG